MSTKIQGYIFDKNYSMKGVLKWCKQSKNIFMKEFYKQIKSDYIDIATDILDRCHYMSKEQIDKYVKARYLMDNLTYGLEIDDIITIARRYQEKPERYYTKYDYKLECSILVSKKHVLVMFFGNNFGLLPKYEDEEETKLIEGKIKNILPFDYFNNVGYPSDEVEFKRREEVWGEALPSENPARDGFYYTFTSADEINFFLESKKVTSNISFNDRIKNNTEIILNQIFESKVRKNNWKDDYSNKKRDFNNSNEKKELELKIKRFLESKLPNDYNDILNESINLDVTKYKYILK